jgi:hypothetical protein
MKVVYSIAYLLLLVGCKESASEDSSPSSSKIDPDGSFSRVLDELDSAIGERFQSMEMAAMVSATYMYDGSIDEVVAVVDPLVTKMGYEGSDKNPMDKLLSEAADEQKKMGMSMQNVSGRNYKHKNGNMIIIMRMDVAHEKREMKMLTVQLLNPGLMSEMGSKLEP